jgi:hypothetical protein
MAVIVLLEYQTIVVALSIKKQTNKRVFGKYVYLPRITHESSKAYFQWGPV